MPLTAKLDLAGVAWATCDDEPVVSKLWMYVKAMFKDLLQHLLT